MDEARLGEVHRQHMPELWAPTNSSNKLLYLEAVMCDLMRN